MLIVLLVVVVILIITGSLFAHVSGFLRFNSNLIQKEQAIHLAEAGVDYAVWKLNKTAGAYTGPETITLGSTGAFTVSITNVGSAFKKVTSTGYVPNAANPRAKQTIKVDVLIDTDTIAFRYAVQVGNGGVVMQNSATINGNVYSNAPDGANKSIQGSGSSQINGEAWTVGTVSTPDPTLNCTTPPCKHENQPPSEMPNIDEKVAGWKTTAEAGGTTTCADTPALCNIDSNTAIGPQKYVGNLTISNNAIVTVNGAIYITGNLSVSQGGTEINLNNNLGSQGVGFVVSGTLSISQGAKFNPTNANPKGYIMVVTESTSNSAMSIGQSGANAVFYALNGGTQLSQTANVNALVAKSLTMQNSAALTYESGLASTQFTTGPGGSWEIKRGTYRFASSP